MVWALRLLLLLVPVAAQDVCASGSYVDVRWSTPDGSAHELYLPLGAFGRGPPFGSSRPAPLVVPQPADGCSAFEPPPPPGAVLLVHRGACTFVQKARQAATSEAAGVIVINNSSDCLVMGTGDQDDDQGVQHVFIASARLDEGARLQELAQQSAKIGPQANAMVSYAARRITVADPAALVLLLMAVGTIAGASVWATSAQTAVSTMEAATQLADPSEVEEGGAGSLEAGAEAAATVGGGLQAVPLPAADDEHVVLTLTHVAAFAVFSTAFMFLLFFLLNNYFFMLFLAFFSYGAFVSALFCGRAALRALKPAWAAVVVFRRGDLHVSAADVLAFCCSACAVVVWLLNRTSSWAWLLQNALGICLILVVLHSVSLPDGRIGSTFLAVLFAYDIFMVFITPLFMPGGDSVMVKVATGGSSHQIMPMLLVVPRLLPPLHTAMMLGYGDVMVPGLFIVLLRRFDVACQRSLRQSYMLPVLAAYSAGLLLTDVALQFHWGGSQGQPALLYLVPSTLLTTWALAWCRGDVLALWTGRIDDEKDHDSGTEEVDEEAGGAAAAAQARERARPRLTAADPPVPETQRLL